MNWYSGILYSEAERPFLNKAFPLWIVSVYIWAGKVIIRFTLPTSGLPMGFLCADSSGYSRCILATGRFTMETGSVCMCWSPSPFCFFPLYPLLLLYRVVPLFEGVSLFCAILLSSYRSVSQTGIPHRIAAPVCSVCGLFLQMQMRLVKGSVWSEFQNKVVLLASSPDRAAV